MRCFVRYLVHISYNIVSGFDAAPFPFVIKLIMHQTEKKLFLFGLRSLYFGLKIENASGLCAMKATF